MCKYDIEFYSDSMAIDILGIDLFQKISKAVISRKAEFLAGRILVNHILATLEFEKIKLDIGSNRQPIWPQNIKGSISHVDQIVICAICTSKKFKRIGIDIELLNEDIPQDLTKTIMNLEEENLAKKYNIKKPHYFSLVFSAKESLFKALYPEVNHYFDFDIAVVTDIDTEKQKLTLSLNYGLTPIHQQGRTYTCRYIFSKKYIITLLC